MRTGSAALGEALENASSPPPDTPSNPNLEVPAHQSQGAWPRHCSGFISLHQFSHLHSGVAGGASGAEGCHGRMLCVGNSWCVWAWMMRVGVGGTSEGLVRLPEPWLSSAFAGGRALHSDLTCPQEPASTCALCPFLQPLASSSFVSTAFPCWPALPSQGPAQRSCLPSPSSSTYACFTPVFAQREDGG